MVNKCSAGKENVPLALEVMHETTITAARSYFPNRRDVANFLEMFNTWWTISNSKKRFSPNILEMLWSMGTKNWFFKNSGGLDWTMVPVSCIHTDTSDCFCIDYYSLCPCYVHRRLIEWGLSYQYVITAKLQSDPFRDVFPSTGEWMAVVFLSICKKSKTPRRFCNAVLYLMKILTFGKRILHLKIRSVLL